MIEWQWLPVLAGGGWLSFRLLAELYCRWAAKRWFGNPEQGSIRLFGRGRRRPIQSFESLLMPTIGIHDNFEDYAKKRKKFESWLNKKRFEWEALGDGLVVGAGAYAVAVASSAEAHSTLVDLPNSLDKIDVGATQISAMSSAQQTGYESWLQGHIGESIAANVLTAQGHHVEFATISNQPGWDLMVDGIPVNVKVGESAAANIGEHFDKYPNIEVVTDTHTATLLNHPLVHGLPGLEPDRIQALAHVSNTTGTLPDHSAPMVDEHWDALHGAHEGTAHGFTAGADYSLGGQDGVDGVGLDLDHVPLITVGFGVFRELKLAEKFGGNFEESLGAIAADAVGVAAGAKVGSVAGAILGPVGMMVGAILGAIVGKNIVSEARKENVEAEVKRLKPELEAIDAAWKRSAEVFAADAKQVVDRWNQELNSETKPDIETYRQTIDKLAGEHDRATIAFFKSVHEAFDRFDEWLNQDLFEIRRRFPARPRWKQVLFPSKSESARALAETWLANKRIELAQWREKFGRPIAEQELTGSFDLASARELLMEFMNKYKVWDSDAAPVLKTTLDEFESISKRATRAHKHAMKKIIQKLRVCERKARSELKVLWAQHERSLVTLTQKVDKEIRDLARRAARARLTSFHPPLELIEQRSQAVKANIKSHTSGADRISKLPAFR